MFKLKKKPAAHKRGHPTLQNMNFKKKFLLLWVIFALLDPDPDPLARLNPDPIRIRIRNPAQKYLITIKYLAVFRIRNILVKIIKKSQNSRVEIKVFQIICLLMGIDGKIRILTIMVLRIRIRTIMVLRVRIRDTQKLTDPDPKHCYLLSTELLAN
jgi:hypothetical protein